MATKASKRQPHRGDDALRLWLRYRATGDQALRNQLISAYTPLVKSIVFRKVRELPSHCEFEDFFSCGLEAMMSSLDRYDPHRGATLEQFIWTRVHGAVLDELRNLDWAPRWLRHWERELSKARTQFFDAHHRHPTTCELSQALGLSPDKLARIEAEIASSDITSLNGVVAGDGATVEHLDNVRCTDGHCDPEQVTARQEAYDKLREALEGLSERERKVAVLMYVQGLKLREIGDILGVSESRVCQMHTSLTRTLRAALQADDALFREASQAS